jgi:hypothetical protein
MHVARWNEGGQSVVFIRALFTNGNSSAMMYAVDAFYKVACLGIQNVQVDAHLLIYTPSRATEILCH